MSVPPAVSRHVVELASRAPSVYNTQPWAWRILDHGIELYADHQRRLPVADPSGRELVMSCGAALHHARVAAHALGWATDVERFPDPRRPALLARLGMRPVLPARSAAADLAALQDRRTDRRRFTAWPVADERLEQLAAVARGEGTGAVTVTDVAERFRVELLLSRALQLQARDSDLAAEQARWVGLRRADGVPARTVPHRAAAETSYGSRFGIGLLEDTSRDGHDEALGNDGLVVLHDDHDDQASWLRGGEGLSALWLQAVRHGLSVVPLSQVVEVPETRESLRHDVLGGMAAPLLVLRVGWQAIGRSQLDPTPRRPVDDVLLP